MKKIRCLEEFCVGKCNDCREQVYVLIMSDGTVRCQANHCSCCCKQEGDNILITTYSDTEADELLLMHLVWSEVNWDSETVSVPKQSTYDVMSLPKEYLKWM